MPVVANIITIPVLARVLGPDGRGQAAAGTAAVLLAVAICAFGMPEALTYFIAKFNGLIDRRQVVAALLLAVVAGTVGAILLCQFSRILSGGDKTIRELIILTSWSLIPILTCGVFRGIAAGLHRWDLVGTERSISAMLKAILIVALALGGVLDVNLSALIIAYSQCIGIVAYVGLLRRKRYGRAGDVRSLFSFAIQLWISALAAIVLLRIDQVLMTPLSNAAELGLYVVAVAAAEMPLIINSALREIMYAADSERQDDARIGLGSRLSTYGVLSVSLVIALSAPIGFPIIFGREFSGSIVPCLILLCAGVIGNPASIVSAALSARGHLRVRIASLAAAAAVNICMVFLLVPRFGAVGASVAMLVGNAVSSAVVVLFFRKQYGTPLSTFYMFKRSDAPILADIGRRAFLSVGRRFRRSGA